ncbi:beclin 1-associated autophagy-related key regulator-like [Dermacentor silvarum]|uniref:beclin 1-associated autophagy-related key regulator-like n=1 Tax=Dermacentor silvarum TaxID=543639 RepID=UPI002101D3A0|nr:beclin 1-associated autophagy-related key regulator-like [Dermacentor silvarum]
MDMLELSAVGAPREFPVPSSSSESSRSSSGASMSCRVCLQLRSNFFCEECIRNGDFTRSQVLCPERFAEKKLRLLTLQRHKASLEKSILEMSGPMLKKEALRDAIQRTRDQVAYLRIVLEDLKRRREEGKFFPGVGAGLVAHAKCGVPDMHGPASVALARVMHRCGDSGVLCPLTSRQDSQLKQERFEYCLAEQDVLHVQGQLHQRSQQLHELQESLEEKRRRLAECQLRRQELVRAYVGDLARDIFPIHEEERPQPLGSSMEPSGSSSAGVTAAGGREQHELEEAQQTVYVRGRWVHLAPTEGCYNLVGVRLPTSGDYSQYCHWLAEQQERAWPAPEEPCNVGYTLSAGLMYAAQMVAVLAFYLDVPLPHSLCYSQFGARDESEDDFRNLVARLNSNVLHLCASQGLEPPLLRPRTTLRNLALLVQHQGNIRLGPFEMSSDLWASLEESLGPELQPSDPDSDDNDDWEDVTEDSPKADIQWRPSSPQPSSSLLSSAAALVTNFWRPK